MKSSLSSSHSQRHIKCAWFFLYTALFAAVCLILFFRYYTTGRTFIYSSDGLSQHYPALIYYARYLREIFRGVLSGQGLVIPNWSFCLGEGGDILTTLHYYVIGDPLTLLAAFVPVRFMHLCYNGLILLRLYLAGLCFSLFCFQMGNKNLYAVLSGALSYVFCGFALFAAVRHPFFINPMIYLPLLLMGIEKILAKKRPWLFISSVCLSAVSNFYFFYMLVLLTILYTAVRLTVLFHGRMRQAWLPFVKIAASSILGVMLSAVILLPVGFAFLSDSRMASGFSFRLLYPISYYSKLPAFFLSYGEEKWLVMAYAAPVFLSICLLFMKRRQHQTLKRFFLFGIVFLLFPVFGQIFNGFSYECNRWCQALSFLVSYILVVMWPSLLSLSKKEGLFLFLCTGAYSALCIFLKDSRTTGAFLSIVLAAVLLILLCIHSRLKPKSSRLMQTCMLAVTLSGVICNGCLLYLPEPFGQDYTSKFAETKKIQDPFSSEADAVKAAAGTDSDFFRYSGRELTPNNLLTGLSGTAFYWTISSPYTSEYRTKLDINEYRLYQFLNHDDRTALSALACVKYYVLPEQSSSLIPFGFQYLDTADVSVEGTTKRCHIYENTCALPLGYTCSSYIPAEACASLSAVELQEAQLTGPVLSEKPKSILPAEPKLTSQSCAYTVTENGGGVAWNDGIFEVSKENASVILEFSGLPESEVYACLQNFDYTAHMEKTSSEEAPEIAPIYFMTSANEGKYFVYYTKENSWYNGRHNFDINLGYSEEPVNSILLMFPQPGTYSFDSLDIVCQPMSGYREQIEHLKEVVLEDVTIGIDKITGTVSSDTPRLLCLSIPYSKGWSCLVDGEKTKLLRADTMYMAVELEKGTHTVTLTYDTPFLKEGALLSLIALSLFCFLIGASKSTH